jgi:hypothetical protein
VSHSTAPYRPLNVVAKCENPHKTSPWQDAHKVGMQATYVKLALEVTPPPQGED